MKIQAACRAAGLTERTVRCYIEEDLIAPDYGESYLGRKTFYFSEADIRRLRDAAVLRKCGFSVDEIRQMLESPEKFAEIIEKLRPRAEHLPIPAEDDAWDAMGAAWKAGGMMLLFAAVWIPFVMTGLALADGLRWYHYPAVAPKALVLSVLLLVPPVLLALVPKTVRNANRKKNLRKILVILCLLCIPLCRLVPFAIFNRSVTTDFRNYRDLDPECLANRSSLFQELFPKWPRYFENVRQSDGSWEAVYLDAHYLYQYSNSWDYTYDIIAEWPLEEEDFHAEVSRVAAVFAEREYMTMEKGGYTCLIVHTGNPPFEQVTGSYTYCIFAYDEENLRVRYIYCDSLDDGADQPAYLQLDWT